MMTNIRLFLILPFMFLHNSLYCAEFQANKNGRGNNADLTVEAVVRRQFAIYGLPGETFETFYQKIKRRNDHQQALVKGLEVLFARAGNRSVQLLLELEEKERKARKALEEQLNAMIEKAGS